MSRACPSPLMRFDRRLLVLALAGVVGCPGAGDDAGDERAAQPPPRFVGVEGERLGPLPSPANATSARFATSDVCAQCHLSGDTPLIRDPKGRDVSPVGTWKTSAMALAARDPYYLAAFADELDARPNLTQTVEAICTRCHAPAGAVELESSAKVPTFAMLTNAADSSPAAHLARDGVTCSLCHQIADVGLGTRTSFTGGFVIEDQRRIYGPYQNPLGDLMRLIDDYTPVYGAHIQRSALCATCHTVITNPRDARGYVGPDFPEQVPYLEWLASSYANEAAQGEKAAACQDCHMLAVDDDDVPLEVAIARLPGDLAPRKPFWRHEFAGGNVMLARFGAADPAWFGVPLTREDHERQRGLDEAMLRRAATLAVAAERKPEGVVASVTITNESGHKLPTGYPSRRLIVHVRVASPAGETLYESGAVDEFGRLVARDGALAEPETFFRHFDVVEEETQVQIYESFPLDVRGKPAHRPLDAYKYGKDNRLEPHGFNRFSAFAGYLRSVGVDGDPDWGPSDVVKYRIGDVPPGSIVTVELLFQIARPVDIEAFAESPTPAARRLFDFVLAAPLTPVVIASATTHVP